MIVRSGGDTIRCYVHPVSLEIMHQTIVDEQFINIVKKIHGELLLGSWGSHVVELAACWTIVMILSGVYLWWPRRWTGFAGVLYPRLFSGKKPFWRDIHNVAGVWISAFALILILTGLPWAAFWGDYFKSIRTWTGTAVARQDWSVGNESPQANSLGEHASHTEGHETSHSAGHGAAKRAGAIIDWSEIDRVALSVRPLDLAAPVILSPPSKRHGDWTVQSMTGNRPRRVTLTISGSTGAVTSGQVFADRHWVDRVVGTGIALHEGQLFGWLNQAIGLVTVLGLMLLSASGVVLWWRRRGVGVLGAPQAAQTNTRSPLLWISIIALAVYLPVFGASLLLVRLVEKSVLQRLSITRNWLGLAET